MATIEIKHRFTLATLLALTGCQYGTIDVTHLSHPLVGPPLTSARDAQGFQREGWINEVGATLGSCYGRLCVEQSLGYDLSYNRYTSMRGGAFLYVGKVSYRVFGVSR